MGYMTIDICDICPEWMQQTLLHFLNIELYSVFEHERSLFNRTNTEMHSCTIHTIQRRQEQQLVRRLVFFPVFLRYLPKSLHTNSSKEWSKKMIWTRGSTTETMRFICVSVRKLFRTYQLWNRCFLHPIILKRKISKETNCGDKIYLPN